MFCNTFLYFCTFCTFVEIWMEANKWRQKVGDGKTDKVESRGAMYIVLYVAPFKGG